MHLMLNMFPVMISILHDMISQTVMWLMDNWILYMFIGPSCDGLFIMVGCCISYWVNNIIDILSFIFIYINII